MESAQNQGVVPDTQSETPLPAARLARSGFSSRIFQYWDYGHTQAISTGAGFSI